MTRCFPFCGRVPHACCLISSCLPADSYICGSLWRTTTQPTWSSAHNNPPRHRGTQETLFHIKISLFHTDMPPNHKVVVQKYQGWDLPVLTVWSTKSSLLQQRAIPKCVISYLNNCNFSVFQHVLMSCCYILQSAKPNTSLTQLVVSFQRCVQGLTKAPFAWQLFTLIHLRNGTTVSHFTPLQLSCKQLKKQKSEFEMFFVYSNSFFYWPYVLHGEVGLYFLYSSHLEEEAPDVLASLMRNCHVVSLLTLMLIWLHGLSREGEFVPAWWGLWFTS